MVSSAFHPMDPLTPEEMSAVSLSIKAYLAKETDVKAIKFMTCSMLAPPKKDVLKSLGIPTYPGEKVPKREDTSFTPKRRAETDFIDLVTGDAYNARSLLNENQEWQVYKLTKLPVGVQPQITVQELIMAEDTIRADESVRKLAAEIGLTPDQLFADGWSIGYDDRFPESTRLQQCLLYARFGKDENLYSHPLDFFPVIDSNSLEVIHIDFAPHRSSKLSKTPALSATTQPPVLGSVEEALSASGRNRIAPPKERHEYLPDLPGFNGGSGEDKKGLRTDVKPLHVVQPEGVSFTMNGNEIEWQKWKLHVAFSHREGIALSTITYNDNGELRPILFRFSLAEMVVPYGAPEHPHPRKFAFDVGEYGMGTQANELSLGCDCLGKIHYLPGSYIGHDGLPIHVRNAICIHEEDSGILFKHTDFRPGGRVHTVRGRRLVISMICTVANYEYCFYYYFYQDGGIELEIRLTGILNVYVLAEGEHPYADGVPSFGTEVAPRINAHYHQHIFSLRLDPMIDGLSNSVVETDVIPYDFPTGSAENFAGNGWTAIDTTLSNSATDGVRMYDASKDRRWRIVNPSRQHYSSNKDVGYVLGLKGSTAEMLAKDDGWAATRARFAQKTLWVVKDRDDGDEEAEERMFPAGKYVPQTKSDPPDSVAKWAAEGGKIDNEDILVFVTLGVNHIPRPEDWPVMPSEHVRFTMKPVHFFKANPALDVPGRRDSHSLPAFVNGHNVANGVNGVANGVNGVNGDRGASCH